MSIRAIDLSARMPLVGRHGELQQFRAAHEAVAGGSPRVIQITGEIGLGRTRLLQAFAEHADAERAVWILTRTRRSDEVPLGPLLQADTSTPLSALHDAMVISGGNGDHFERLITALAEDARRAPVWLLLDDVHASDEATRAFTERLVAALHHGALRDARIGVVLSLLSDHDGAGLTERLKLQDRHGATTHVVLKAFETDEIRDWLEARFDSTPDAGLVRLLCNASGGNPLLLTELAIYLRRAGVLHQVDGRLTTGSSASGDANGLTLPRDLTSLLRGKIRSISGECRRAMTLAAFLGNEFDATALGELLERDSDDLQPLIEEAAQASLVERGDGRTVSFKHSSARDLFYASPDRITREDTHLQVCQGLLGEFGENADEHCLTITHHLIRAGGRADPALVLRFASQAADMAFRHHSYYLAGRYYEAAALAGGELLSTAQRAALHCRAGEAFQRWSDAARSTDCFREAVRLYRACDDLAGHARALQGLLRNLVAFGEADGRAADVADELQGLLAALPEHDAELRVRVHDTLASYHHDAARYDIAESFAQTAMSIATGSGDPTLRCIPVTSLALAQMEQLRLTDARTTWLEGLSYDRAAGASRYEGLHLQRLPIPLYCLGETLEAARYNQASYQHNEAIGNTAELTLNLTVDVMIANLRGDFETAIGAGREALEMMASTRYLWHAPSLIGALAYALTMCRRFDEAGSVIERLSTSGWMFEDAAPYRRTAARLTELMNAHRDDGPDHVAASPLDSGRGLRGVRVGSLGRLCCEAELALFQRRPERLTGVHDALEFVHRRALALSLGWCCSVPRSLAVSTALRQGMSRAAGYFTEAFRLAERANAPLEHGRVQLYRGLAALCCAGGDVGAARDDLTGALSCFESRDAAALADLAENALPRRAARPID